MIDPTSTTYIRFLANARPARLAGDYRITVTQSTPAFPTAAKPPPPP